MASKKTPLKKAVPAKKAAAKKAPAKKAAVKKAAVKKAAAKKVVAKKAPAKKAPAKKVPAKKAPAKPVSAQAKRQAAIDQLVATAKAKKGRMRSAPEPLYMDGVLIPSDSPSGVAFQFANETVTLEAVAEAGEFVGLLVQLKAGVNALEGGPSLLQKLGDFLAAHADGQVAGGVTTCRNHHP